MRLFTLLLFSLTLLACGDPTGRDEITPEVVEIFERMAAQEFETLSGEIEISTVAPGADGAPQVSDPVIISIDMQAPASFHCTAERGYNRFGALVHDGSVVRRETLGGRETLISAGVGTWAETNRSALEALTRQECTVLIALFGFVPPYDELLALPTPKGEEAVTIIRGEREIDGHLCDVIEIRNVFQGRNVMQRYLADVDTGMLRQMELEAHPVGAPDNMMSVVERFSNLSIGEPIDPALLNTAPEEGLPVKGLFAETGEEVDLGTIMDAAAITKTQSIASEIESRRWRRQGANEISNIGVATVQPDALSLTASSERWVSSSTLTIENGSSTLESSFPKRGPEINAVGDITCETLADLGLMHTPLVSAMLGLECEPLASWIENAQGARITGTEIITEGGGELQIITVPTSHASGAPVTMLLGIDPATGAIHHLDSYSESANGEMKRMSSDSALSLEIR